MEPVRAVSEDQLESIYAASLRVLSETGIDFLHPTARQLWANAGADLDGDRVRLDPELVSTPDGHGSVGLHPARAQPRP